LWRDRGSFLRGVSIRFLWLIFKLLSPHITIATLPTGCTWCL
jgi:hypothetical protein